MPTLWSEGEGWNTCPDKNCHNRQVGFRGSRGDTQEKPSGAARETLTDALIVSGQLVDIRKRSFIRFVRESELPILPLGFQGQQNPDENREKGQYLHHVSKERKERRLSRKPSGLETPEKIRELQRKLDQKAKQEKEYRF